MLGFDGRSHLVLQKVHLIVFFFLFFSGWTQVKIMAKRLLQSPHLRLLQTSFKNSYKLETKYCWMRLCKSADFHSSSKDLQKNSEQTADACTSPDTDQCTTTFKKFYRFQYIIGMRLISRMKLYQTGLTVLALPPITYGFLQGSVDLIHVQVCYSIAAFAGVMLYVMSGYFRNIVCELALNPNNDFIRLSHLTFWGKRSEKYFHTDEIVPLTDTAEQSSDVYVKLQLYDSKEEFYIFMPRQGIVNVDLYRKVLGNFVWLVGQNIWGLSLKSIFSVHWCTQWLY